MGNEQEKEQEPIKNAPVVGGDHIGVGEISGGTVAMGQDAQAICNQDGALDLLAQAQNGANSLKWVINGVKKRLPHGVKRTGWPSMIQLLLLSLLNR